MSESARKYPKEVKAIYIAGAPGEKGRKVEAETSESEKAPRVSKMTRDWDREVRVYATAASEFFKTYLEHHEASNAETRDGGLKHFGKNAVKAHKAAFKVLQNNSKAFAYDPAEIHDHIVEYMEDLEEEYEETEASFRSTKKEASE